MSPTTAVGSACQPVQDHEDGITRDVGLSNVPFLTGRTNEFAEVPMFLKRLEHGMCYKEEGHGPPLE